MASMKQGQGRGMILQLDNFIFVIASAHHPTLPYGLHTLIAGTKDYEPCSKIMHGGLHTVQDTDKADVCNVSWLHIVA
jgi:hypothetical protein